MEHKKIVVARLIFPIIWPIQYNINLTQNELTTLEEVGFSFYRFHRSNT
jgi:hypothetical protein